MKLKKVMVAMVIMQLAGSALAAEKLTSEQAQNEMIRGTCESFSASIANSKFANTPEKLEAAFAALRQKLKTPQGTQKLKPARQMTDNVLQEMAFDSCRDFIGDMFGAVETDKTRRELAGLSR